MPDSLTEIVVELFYRSKGYLVERNVPIVAEDGPQHWSDLDILAVRDDVRLVNCKDFVSDKSQRDKIAKNLEQAEAWVTKNYGDVVANKPIIREFVYSSSDKGTNACLDTKGIKCRSVEEIFACYLKTLEGAMDKLNTTYKAPKGLRWYRIGNLSRYDKVFVFLLNGGFLKLSDDGELRQFGS